MYRHTSLHRARSHYEGVALASEIEAASPHQLVTILYRTLTETLETIIAAMIKDDRMKLRDQHARAQSILHALEGGLDVPQGGELAVQLNSVYRRCRAHLAQAASAGDSDGLTELRDGVTAMAEAWSAIGVNRGAV
jgi:flagellar secretion chaperone FliS